MGLSTALSLTQQVKAVAEAPAQYKHEKRRMVT